jgi:catechol 2,3-dioxygenase-like lactoylglutathione lyase family enzyme
MKFEHFALNVEDARQTARWYVEHLGLAIVRGVETAPYTRFLADITGRLVMELYSNPAAPVPDFRAAHPLTFHVGFATDDARATQQRLEMAGARLFHEETLADGSVLVMVRDPWGIPIQLCQRAGSR